MFQLARFFATLSDVRSNVMKKWIITWDAGCGPSSEVIEAVSFEKAEQEAYEQWKQEAEDQAEYTAEPWTQELEDAKCK